MENIIISTYPEGWDNAKKLLVNVPEQQREEYLMGYMMTILCN